MSRLILLMALCAAALTGLLPQARAQGGFGFGPLGLKLDLPSHTAGPLSAARGEAALKQDAPFVGAIGLQVAPTLWLEGEALSRRVALDAGFAETDISMVNLSYQPSLGSVTPFVTAGAGLARQDGSISDSGGFAKSENETGASFAWQLGGGVQYRAGEDTAITGSYRYLTSGPIGLAVQESYEDHEFWVRTNHTLPVRRNLEPLKGSKNYNP